MITPVEAVAIARRQLGSTTAEPEVLENANGYAVSFQDHDSRLKTMSSVWIWVDKSSGDTELIPASRMVVLMDDLQPVAL